MEATLPPTPPSDEELMERVQQGDAAAYETLFRRHQQRVYGYLVRRMRDPVAASDAFQETFLSVHRARNSWDRRRAFRPWLYRIATNAARDHGRRVRRLPPTAELDVAPGHRESPEDRLALQRAMEQLPDNLREAFLLGAVEGMDHNELAEALEISPANARARLSRARSRLRELLTGEDPA